MNQFNIRLNNLREYFSRNTNKINYYVHGSFYYILFYFIHIMTEFILIISKILLIIINKNYTVFSHTLLIIIIKFLLLFIIRNYYYSMFL